MEVAPVVTSYMPSLVFYPLLLLAAVLLATYYFIESSAEMKLAMKIPGPPGLPIFGNALLTFGVEPKDVVKKLLEHDIYGPVIRATFGTRKFVFLKDPRDIEIFLSSSVHIDKAMEYKYFKPWLGDGLLINTGEKWRYHRKLIAPTFHMSVLKTFVPLFYENSMELVQRLRKEVGKEFDCHYYMSEVTVDILMETAMGFKKEKSKTSGLDYAIAVLKLCNIIHRRQYNFLMRIDTIYRWTKTQKIQEKLLHIAHGLTHKMVDARKQEMADGVMSPAEEADENRTEEQKAFNANSKNSMKMHYVRDDLDDIEENDIGEKKRLAFLDFLLEVSRNGQHLTEEEVKEEVDTIMFEGHDTTTAASSFVLCILGLYQDIQQRVFEEIDEIFKGSDRQCTFQDTLEMKYLERVIMETIRLYPPVPVIARKIKEHVKLATSDNVIPKDTTLLVSMYSVHRSPDYYPNPETFDPDNFLPERMQQRHYYSFIPFSAGPRSCVGRKFALLKLKVLLSTILRNYRVYSNVPEKDFGLQVDIILKRVEGFPIRIEPREKFYHEERA